MSVVAPAMVAATERQALVSLALASLKNRDEVTSALAAAYPDFTPVSPPVAIDVLTSAATAPRRRLPRIVLLDALFRLQLRTGYFTSAGADVQEAVFRAGGAMAAAGPPRQTDRGAEPDPDALAPPLKSDPPQLDAAGKELQKALQVRPGVAVPGPLSVQHAWEAFIGVGSKGKTPGGGGGLVAALSLATEEVDRPFCDCGETMVVNGYEATVVRVDFETEYPVDKMRRYADPTNWPRYSAFFRDLHSRGPRTQSSHSWEDTFEEVIDVLPGLTLYNPLRFTYEETVKGKSVLSARSTYKLVDPTPHIVVDQGFISVRANGKRSDVSVVKVIRFTDEFVQQWPSIACDLFWGDLSLNMAVRCASGN